MMRRRAVVAGLSALLLAPEQSSAQQAPTKIPRIGILSPAERPDTKIFDAFREGLRELGYIDGQNIRIDYRLAAGDPSRLPGMAEELVACPSMSSSPTGQPYGSRRKPREPSQLSAQSDLIW